MHAISTAFERGRDTPDDVALVDPSGAKSWGEVADRVARTANALLELGFPPGSRLAVFGANRADTLLVYAGAACAGIGAILVNHHLAADEVEYLLRDGGARALWASPEHLETAERAAKRCDVPVLHDAADSEWAARVGGASSALPSPERAADFDLIYTSGTTGRPKGVEVPIRMTPTVRGRFEVYEQHHCVGLGPHLVVSPLYHSGPHAAVGLLLTGHKVVIVGKFDAERVLAAIAEHSIGTTVMVPTHFVRLLSLPEELRRSADVSSIRMIAHTGSSCPVPVKQAMIDWFGPVLREAYGGTESGIISAIKSDEWLRHPGSVGRVAPPFHALILDEDGKPCTPGQDGQLYFVDDTGRGIRYLGDAARTEAAHLVPGTFTLGDVGHIDESGYLYVTGRVTDMVISGGVNIYPAECERVLSDHPSVSDLALFGVPDDEMGERLVGLVTTKDEDTTPEQLLEYCRAAIARYKVPKELRIVGTIPRSPMGKIDKRALRDAFVGGEA